MNTIKRIFAFLRRLVGLEDDIERIMKPITKIVTKLDAHREQQLAKAEADDKAAVVAQARAARQREVASEAERLRDKFAA